MNIFKAMAVKDVAEGTRTIPVIDFGPAFRGEPGGLPAGAGQVGHGCRGAMMAACFKTMQALGERILPVLARSLELPKDFFAPFFANEAHVNLRFLHYPPQEVEDEEQFGQGPHTDNSFFTMLAREEVPGLAVRLPSGEWLGAPLDAD